MSELPGNPKKPKLKEEEEEEEEEEANVSYRDEQEEVLVALVEHRSNEIERINHHISNYQTKLIEAERSLQNSKAKLAQLRGVSSVPSKPLKTLRNVSEDYASPSPSKTLRPCDSSDHPRTSSASSVSKAKTVVVKPKSEPSRDSPNVKDRGTKRKFEQKEHKELIRLIARNSSPTTIKCHTSNQISSQHKRKLRSLILCPVNEQLFATSSLDGMVSLWQLQPGRLAASLLSTTDCLSRKQRRWAEDMAWHPSGHTLFSVYAADDGDSQISILNLNKTRGVTFLENKPHVKGIINNIKFMPWENTCFVTGGSDHAVVLWNESDNEENKWKSKPLHRNLHSAAVMGVDGMRNKNVVLSVGADKRICGFDVQVGRADYKHQIDYKCMSVLSNPCDFNLFMVQSGEPEKQLRLFDIRLRKTELHSFGWKQDSSESQSALINQSWSPDGLYITSGSVDPVIHVFDIRYNARKPAQSIKAHQKRVFKAEWHYSQPLLISISSDLNIGLHKIS
ncbi:PREDICTED: protein tipD-like [Camelina sativa]|uniref:Protein tipD-like n=1 Tax=Camelina sativa TaxID=90675 RepID=A0ABM0UKS0_CAMSA|nr:PREDICTED: protein tipD-like [Camelina sativa]